MNERGISSRGQVTLFVIIGVAIVVLIIGFFTLRGTVDVGDVAGSGEVYSAVLGCVDDITSEAVLAIGESGGYFNSPELVNDQYIAYHFVQSEGYFPQLSLIESELADYVEVMLYFCVEKEYARMNDLEIRGGDISVTSQVRSDDSIYFSIDYPVVVSRDNNSVSFNSAIERVFDVRLYSMYGVMERMLVESLEHPRSLCLSCLSADLEANNLKMNMWDSNSEDVIYFLTDESGVVNSEEFIFFYVYKYERGYYDPFEAI